jgi:TrmH family RNA methyltransferase
VPAAKAIRRGLRSTKVALLFGSEKWGLSNESLSYCHWLLHIPARKEHRSMNLGQAVAICLYELVRTNLKLDVGRASPERGKAASAETLDRITRTFLDALRVSGYINPRSAGSAEEKLRRLVRRLKMESADAEVLLGMFHKIVWKLGSE